MIIDYDSRETNTPAGTIRVAGLNNQTNRITLDAGDYRILGEVLIEVKTIGDLVSSILSGRFHYQMEKCREQAKEVILIIEGLMTVNANFKLVEPSGERRISWDFIHFSLLSQQRAGVCILSSVHPLHTANILKSLYNYYSRLDHTSIGLRPKILATPNLSNQEACLTAIEGIENDKAKALMKYFGSVVRVAIASTDELIQVKGIGSNSATEIWKFFSEECYE